MIPLREGDIIEPTPDMYEEAGEWILRLREGGDAAELERFRAWQAEAPARQFAVAEMEVLFEGVRPAAARQLAERQRRTGRQRRFGAMALAASLLLALVGIAERDALSIYLRADERAATGTRAPVRLADGTHVLLNSTAALDEHFTPGERGVTLLRGEAFFDVAKDRTRPFVISAGAARITVVGTHFNVRMDEGETTVTVEEGVVRLAGNKGAGPEIRLTAGQQGLVEGRNAQLQPDFDALAVAAWKRGQLVFYNSRIDTVLAELNRYRTGPVILVNRSFARDRISGVFRTRDTDDIVRSLEKQLGVRALSLPGGAILLY